MSGLRGLMGGTGSVHKKAIADKYCLNNFGFRVCSLAIGWVANHRCRKNLS